MSHSQMLFRSPRTVLALAAAAIAACSVGEVPTRTDAAATGDGGGSDGAGATACADRIAPASPAHTHDAGGGTNAGLNCVAGGCHLPGNTGEDAPAYQFGGTVYAVGTRNPNAGATVRLRAGTSVATAITDEAGNFSFPAGSLTGMFSAQVDVSACPGGTAMAAAVVSGGDLTENNCNGCHGPGGSTTPIAL